MKELLKKDWDYVLYEKDFQLVLSVVCGRAALYELNIELNELETIQYHKKGETFISSLANKIRNSPSNFKNRDMKNF